MSLQETSFTVQLILTLKDEREQPITVRTRIVVREEASPSSRTYHAVGEAGEIARFIFELLPGIYLVHIQADGFEVYRQWISLLPEQNQGMRRIRRNDRGTSEYSIEALYEFVLTVKGESEDDVDVLRKRFAWFAEQRTYPGNKFPVDAREKALIYKREMPRIKMPTVQETKSDIPHVSFALAITRPVVPGICNWTALGPRNINGRVRALAIHPTDGMRLYAGSANAGVWQSRDGGQSWAALMHDEDALEIGALAVHLTDPSQSKGDVTVYAGTGEATIHVGYKGIGILKSTQSGLAGTWTATGTFPPPGNDRISVILIDPTSVAADSTKTVVYAGGMNVTDGGVPVPGGLYKSTDGGATWQLMLNKVITGLAMAPTNISILYAGVPGEGIYVYTPPTDTNAGSWQLFNAGLTDPSCKDNAGLPSLLLCHSRSVVLAISQSAPNKIYAKIDKYVYVYDTTAPQPTWQSLRFHGGETNENWSSVLAVDPQDANIVFAGGATLDRSSDGGTPLSWQFAVGLHPDQHALVFDPMNHLHIYVANDGGVYHGIYTDTDITGMWAKVSNGLILTQFHQVDSSSIGPNVVGSGSQDNATGRTVGGLTWDSFSQDRGGGSDGSVLVTDSANPYILYTTVNTPQQNGEIHKSVDGGAHFAPANNGFSGGAWVTPIVLDPNSPPEPNRVLFAGGTNQLYRSMDSAGSWTPSSPVLSGPVTVIEIAPASPAVLYIGTGAGTIGTVWRSSDGGATLTNWKNVTIATQGVPLPNRSITDLAVHPTNPDIVYVTFSGFNVSSIAINPPQSYHVFRATSTDQWATWQWENVSSNLPNIPVNAIEIDRTAPDIVLYVGTDVGVFRTTNGGQAWENFGDGLPNVVVTDIALNATGTVLRAATYGFGMFERRLAATCPPVDIYIRDNKLDTGETFPSPSEVMDPTMVNSFVHWWESPDIKVDPTTHTSTLFDGVQFDQTTPGNVTHTDPQNPAPNHLCIQVHNRGPLPAHNVKVKVLWADASAGLPPLPADFWASYPNDWASPSQWNTVNAQPPFQPIFELLPHTPVIVEWKWAVPPTATEPCVLAVISSDEDPVARSDGNASDHLLSSIVPNDKHIALSNLHILTINIQSGQDALPAVTLLDFHNPFPYPQYFDIVIERSMVPLGSTLSLLLPRTHIQQLVPYAKSSYPAVSSVTGEEWWWDRQEHIAKEEWGYHCHIQADDDEPTGQEPIRIQRILIPAAAKIRSALIVLPPADAKRGSMYRFSVLQYVGNTIIGGSTYEVRISPVEVYGSAWEEES